MADSTLETRVVCEVSLVSLFHFCETDSAPEAAVVHEVSLDSQRLLGGETVPEAPVVHDILLDSLLRFHETD